MGQQRRAGAPSLTSSDALLKKSCDRNPRLGSGHLRTDRPHETAGIGHFERSGLPLGVVRLRLERDAGTLRPPSNLVDVLCRRHEQSHADSLLAIAPLLPIVLAQA